MRPPLCPPELLTTTLSDDYPIHVRHWPAADAAAESAVLYLHGIQSHGGWFERSASLLAHASGLGVFLPDRRGSGVNPEPRGDVVSGERWLADLDELAACLAEQHGIRRLAVVGVSWGGKLAVAWALRQPGRVASLLLITPGVFPAVGLSLPQTLRLVASLAGGGTLRVPIPLSDPALFTDYPEGQRFIRDDPRKLTEATARFLLHSRLLDRRLQRLPGGVLEPPTTLLLAGRDRIIDSPATERWLRRICRAAPAVEIFGSEEHTLEFSADPSRFEQTLGAWAEGLRRGV